MYEFFLHPEFNWSQLENDIAVIRLQNEQFRFTNSFGNAVGAICLPDPGPQVVAGATITTAGWGLQEDSNRRDPHRQHLVKISEPLKVVNTIVRDQSDCKEFVEREWPRKGMSVWENLDARFCTFSEYLHQGACRGDSGGPAMMKKNGKYYVVGTVSGGAACGRSFFSRDFYTRVEPFLS
jgi:secreted trypsin-like serine protease